MNIDIKNLAQLVLPSPMQKIDHPILKERAITLHVKREDLIHPHVSGNKWRKLKYNLKHLLDQNLNGVITFGGAFSNHIHATAAACQLIGLPSIGIIRGEIDPNNPTLRFCHDHGMQLVACSRGDYRLKEHGEVYKTIQTASPNFYTIPEGGSNSLAIRGVEEMVEELTFHEIAPVDHIIVSAGTGCTAAGIIKRTSQSVQVHVNSVLKGDFLSAEINSFLETPKSNWNLWTDYHFGGYAKTTEAILRFIHDFYQQTGIPLDPIYNAKSMYGTLDLIKKGTFEPGSHIVYIHTGGLQGIEGYNYLNPSHPIEV